MRHAVNQLMVLFMALKLIGYYQINDLIGKMFYFDGEGVLPTQFSLNWLI